jgi:hypothetical protein
MIYFNKFINFMAVKKHCLLQIYMFVMAACGVAVLLLLTESGYFNNLFKKIGVYPVPDVYTALFFVDAEKLSLSREGENVTDDFTFGIYNNEGADQEYPFWVNVYTGTTSFLVQKDSLFVKSGETAYKQIAFEDIERYGDSGIVSVILPFHNKSIDFKIN